MGDVALEVPLRLLAIGRRPQGHHPRAARVQRRTDALDGPSFSRRIPSFEDDNELLPRLPDPVLHLDQLEVQFRELLVVDLPLQFLSIAHSASSGMAVARRILDAPAWTRNAGRTRAAFSQLRSIELRRTAL